jgi:hypothetical protein
MGHIRPCSDARSRGGVAGRMQTLAVLSAPLDCLLAVTTGGCAVATTVPATQNSIPTT